jgi:hypothetical protein
VKGSLTLPAARGRRPPAGGAPSWVPRHAAHRAAPPLPSPRPLNPSSHSSSFPSPQKIRFLDDRGYYISNTGFQGPFLPSGDLQIKKHVELKSVSIFCVKKALHDAVLSASGAWPPKVPGARRRALLGTPAAAAAWGAWFGAAARA